MRIKNKKVIDYELNWRDVEEFKKKLLRYREKVDCVVGILNGGAVLGCIAGNILEVSIYWVQGRSYNKRKREELIMTNFSLERKKIKGKNILLVDDIVDTGKTILEGYNMVKDFNPKKILPFVFVVKNKSYQLVKKLGVRYLCIVPDNYWVVFPWEKGGE